MESARALLKVKRNKDAAKILERLSKRHKGESIGRELKYHKDWNWLMPVLKEINLEIHPDTRGAWRMITHCVEYRIEDVHSQVVEFIQEYRLTPKKVV